MRTRACQRRTAEKTRDLNLNCFRSLNIIDHSRSPCAADWGWALLAGLHEGGGGDGVFLQAQSSGPWLSGGGGAAGLQHQTFPAESHVTLEVFPLQHHQLGRHWH